VKKDLDACLEVEFDMRDGSRYRVEGRAVKRGITREVEEGDSK